MEKFIVTTGKTIDLAVTAALQQLGMDRDSVSVEVLENAKSGFLGIGASPAKVKVTYEVPDEPKKPEAPMSVLSSASRSKPKERPEITSSIISRPGRKIEPEEQQPARRERRPRQERRKPQNAETPKQQEKPAEKPQPKVSEPKQEKEQAKEGVVVLTTKAPAKLAAGQTAITATRLELGKSVVFRMTGAAPIKTKTLLLKDPNRYVVDLQGNWGIQLPRVPKDLWISGIRLGHHEESTRLVFELTRAPVSAKVVKINNTTVEVRIQ